MTHMPTDRLKPLGFSDRDCVLWHASARGIEGPRSSVSSAVLDRTVGLQSGGALSTTLEKTPNHYLHATAHLDVADGSARYVMTPDD